MFLNSPEAAAKLLDHRPSLRHRDSYPKFSAKDINLLLEKDLPDLMSLRTFGRSYPASFVAPAQLIEQRITTPRLIETEFPVGPVSAICSKEKSTRHGHISTLQLWWARRPLAVCRAAIFASLVPDPANIDVESSAVKVINDALPGSANPREKLLEFIGELADWKTCNDERTLGIARNLISAFWPERPKVVDTFAGGGSFPVIV
jgi:hypothetical protein